MEQGEIRKKVAASLRQIREAKTLAGSITNTVTMDFVANTQLAAGGAAAMVFMADEAVALAEVGPAFYVNTGTILPPYADSLPQVGAFLHQAGKPWVLDPVGIGMGDIRMAALEAYRATPPTLIRANASEVLALAKLWGLDSASEAQGVVGVESQDNVAAALVAAQALARHTGGAVMVSGKKDLVTDGQALAWVPGGSALMEKVTGFGCALGGLAALYAAVTDPMIAGLAASLHFKIAGQRAQEGAQGPASFKVAFIDLLANLTPQDLQAAPFEWEEI